MLSVKETTLLKLKPRVLDVIAIKLIPKKKTSLPLKQRRRNCKKALFRPKRNRISSRKHRLIIWVKKLHFKLRRWHKITWNVKLKALSKRLTPLVKWKSIEILGCRQLHQKYLIEDLLVLRKMDFQQVSMQAEWQVWISQSWYQSNNSNLIKQWVEEPSLFNNHSLFLQVLLLRKKFSLWIEERILTTRESNTMLRWPRSLNKIQKW